MVLHQPTPPRRHTNCGGRARVHDGGVCPGQRPRPYPHQPARRGKLPSLIHSQLPPPSRRSASQRLLKSIPRRFPIPLAIDSSIVDSSTLVRWRCHVPGTIPCTGNSLGLELLYLNLTTGMVWVQTNDAQNDNLYPYVHLLPNNQLFIFANRDSILFDWQTYQQTGSFPTIPGEPRNYPSAGSSVMLPLNNADGFSYVEILVCGGAQYGAFLYNENDLPASQTCGRIAPLSANPNWEMEV